MLLKSRSSTSLWNHYKYICIISRKPILRFLIEKSTGFCGPIQCVQIVATFGNILHMLYGATLYSYCIMVLTKLERAPTSQVQIGKIPTMLGFEPCANRVEHLQANPLAFNSLSKCPYYLCAAFCRATSCSNHELE